MTPTEQTPTLEVILAELETAISLHNPGSRTVSIAFPTARAARRLIERLATENRDRTRLLNDIGPDRLRHFASTTANRAAHAALLILAESLSNPAPPDTGSPDAKKATNQ